MILFQSQHGWIITSIIKVRDEITYPFPNFHGAQKAKFMEPTWRPPGSRRPQMGPMLAWWTLLFGWFILPGQHLQTCCNLSAATRIKMVERIYGSLRWRRNGHGGVSNHQPHDCLLNRLFRRRSNIKAPRHWPLCGEFTGTGEFPAQRASNAENVSIWWRHYVLIERRLWICGVFQWIKHKAVKCVCLFIYPHSTSLHWIVWYIIYNYNANMVMSFYTNCRQWLHRKSFWQL